MVNTKPSAEEIRCGHRGDFAQVLENERYLLAITVVVANSKARAS